MYASGNSVVPSLGISGTRFGPPCCVSLTGVGLHLGGSVIRLVLLLAFVRLVLSLLVVFLEPMLSILAVFDGTSFISALGVSETCGIPPLIVSFLFFHSDYLF